MGGGGGKVYVVPPPSQIIGVGLAHVILPNCSHESYWYHFELLNILDTVFLKKIKSFSHTHVSQLHGQCTFYFQNYTHGFSKDVRSECDVDNITVEMGPMSPKVICYAALGPLYKT